MIYLIMNAISNLAIKTPRRSRLALEAGLQSDLEQWLTPYLGHVDKRPDPKPCCGEVEEAHEGQCGLIVTGRDTSHLLETVEHPLDAVAVLVAPPICLLWSAAAFA